MTSHLEFLRRIAAIAALLFATGCGGGGDTPTVTPYVTGLTSPRGLTFGPDGLLYVAEAGRGGPLTASNTPDCPAEFNVFGRYSAGFSGRVLRVRADGSKEAVADRLPSTADSTGVAFGPSDLAFIGETLYVLIEMGGCPHGLPNNDASILRINPDGTTTPVANLAAWLAVNPPNFIKDTDPATSDFEPGGVWHSMIAVGDALYVVETNRGMLVKVTPATGSIEKLYDMSIDNAEHNPIVMAQHREQFYVGTFGEDGGPSELAVFDAGFSGYTLPFDSLNPIVGLAWQRERLYAIEIFPLGDPWSPDSAVLVSFDPTTGERKELATKFASFPNGLVVGPDGALYTSNVGTSSARGDGSVLRIDVP